MKNVVELFTSGNFGKTTQENVRTKNAGETYQQWGHRYAGMNGGMRAALMPALQTVVLADHQEQEKDINLQQQQKNRKKEEIENELTNKTKVENEINAQNELKQRKNDDISEAEKEIVRLHNCKERRPMSQAYFIIGCFILILLAVYLFIFYSSAAYEAFFGGEGDFKFKDLFNPHAFRLALDNSLGEFLFILLMPVIFLGLGFLVHRNLKKEHWMKYVKAGILYVITFIFDLLLAFLITKNAYTWEAASSLGELPPYTVSLAFSRPDFWVVIFAGFVAYVIWGLVFDSTMDSYEDITTNSREIRILKNRIEKLKSDIEKIESKIEALKQKATQIQNKINQLQIGLNDMVAYDLTITKNRLSQFFLGWQIYLTGAGKSEREVDEAKIELEKIIETINSK